MLETTFNFAIVIGGAVLFFQVVMMLLGFAHHGGDVSAVHHADPMAGGTFHDGDFSGGSVDDGGSLGHDSAGQDGGHTGAHSIGNWFYEVISIRTLSAAATFYGLVGKIAQAMNFSDKGSFLLAACAGAGGMYGVYWLYKQAYKLQHTGTENIRNAVGASGVVYVPIPAKRAGAGKITFKLQNRLVEYLAVTDDDARIATGEKIEIVGLVSSDTVRVARASKPVTNVVSNTTVR
jgi:hypothetical protein